MSQRQTLPLLPFLAVCMVAGALLRPACAFPSQDSALSLRIDPSFSRARLTTAEQHWYDLIWTHSAGCASTVLARSLYDDVYTYGRSIGDYNSFMLMGLRATGDRAFLDRVKVVTDSMRTKLRDADDACVGGTTDGYLDWRWRAVGMGYSCSNTGGWYGSDHQQLDDAMTHGNLALATYAFVVNADRDTAFASRATFWTDYLLHHWEAKWISRAGGDSVNAWMDNATGMYKHEAHVVANIMRAAYYLWKITGNPFYKARADALAALSATNCVANPSVPTAYSWHHQVGNTDTWQTINYAEHTSGVFCDLHLGGYTPYAGNVEIKKFMSTYRDIVLGTSAPSYLLMDPNVYGGGTQISTSPGYGISAFARWDSTGRMLDYATALSSAAPSASSIYTVPVVAGALLAVSTRGATNAPPSRITDLAAAQVSDSSVTLTWTAPGDDGASGRAAVYELRRSSQPITDANFTAASVVPISQLPSDAGTGEQFVVRGLTPGTPYFFAIRAIDDAANASLVSNNVSVTTLAADTIRPAPIRDLSAKP
jgi:hypothetical protein